jgi:hypothetical protein
MEAIILTTFYTAVGRFERRNGENGQYPVVIVNGKEHMVELSEMMLWTCCNWRIHEFPKLYESYSRMAREAGVDANEGFEDYVERMLRRGLIMSGAGETGADALYDLMSNRYVIPVTSGIFVKVRAFLKLIFIRRLPFIKAKVVFRKETLSDREKRVVDLARQTQLSTAELIKCVETGVYDLSSDEKVMDAIYNDDVTTCDNIGYYVKSSKQQRPVLETVANLYLRKLIIFERV